MNKRSSLIQVQPHYSELEEWKALAGRYDLTFEVLELSGPLVLNKDERPVEIIDQYLNSGLVTSLHGCFIDVNPGSGDDLFRKLSFQRMQESCELAVYLGARNVVFHSACAAFIRGAYLESWADKSAECFEKLASVYDLNFYVENSMDVDPVPIRELMDRIDNPNVEVCLDIGHVEYSRTSLEKWFELLEDRIGYLHLSDNQGLFDDHFAIGQGCVDWKEADRLWRSLRRDTPVTIETNSIENVEQSITYLKQHGLFQFDQM